MSNNPKLKEEQSDRLQNKKEKLVVSKKARQHFDTLLSNEDILWTYDVDYTIFDDPKITNKESFLSACSEKSANEQLNFLELLYHDFSDSFIKKVQSTLPHNISEFAAIDRAARIEEYILRSNPFVTVKMFWLCVGFKNVERKHESDDRVTINPMLPLDGFKYNRLLEVHDRDENDHDIPTTYDTFVNSYWHLNWPTLI